MNQPRVLVVDDESGVVDWLCEGLVHEGFNAHGVTTGSAALAAMEEGPVDLVLSDIEMPGMRGMDLLAAIHQKRPSQLVVLMTAFGSVERAVESVKAGATDFITKPFKLEQLVLTLQRALQQRQVAREVVRLRKQVSNRVAPDGLVAQSPAMVAVLETARRVARVPSPVLLCGESGTGKTALAEYIHQHSGLAKGPFVRVNCAALPAQLAEAELFGARRGAYTDLKEDRVGLFAQAEGGTLFLDEIGELPMDVQPKLLQVLETQKVRPVGGVKEVPVNARVLAATNVALEDALKHKTFRPDLYYRLNVLRVDLPPLRERPQDLSPLLDVLLERACNRVGRNVMALDPEARRWLMAQRWPGNVRELSNTLERAVAVTDRDVITVEDVALAPPTAAAITVAHNPTMSLAELERIHIEQVLQATGGNKVRAAAILGIDRRTLHRKLAAE